MKYIVCVPEEMWDEVFGIVAINAPIGDGDQIIHEKDEDAAKAAMSPGDVFVTQIEIMGDMRVIGIPFNKEGNYSVTKSTPTHRYSGEGMGLMLSHLMGMMPSTIYPTELFDPQSGRRKPASFGGNQRQKRKQAKQVKRKKGKK